MNQPRNVRNFFINLEVDGRNTTVNTGPRSKSGGFSMQVKMKEDGEIKRHDPVTITGTYEGNGKLKLTVNCVNGYTYKNSETETTIT